MATSNISITSTWSKIADSSQAFLASSNARVAVQVATTTADAAPTVAGHLLMMGDAGEAFTRDVIGAGYVWIRTVDVPTATLVVTK